MAYTVRQFVTSALEELGLAAYAYDMGPEQMRSVAKRYNSMLAEWNTKGIKLGATLYDNPDDIDLDTSSDVPDSANEAIITNLALRIAPMFGKQPMQDTRANAKRALNTLTIDFATPIEMQLPSMPAGAGNKPWRWDDAFTPAPEEPLDAGSSDVLEI